MTCTVSRHEEGIHVPVLPNIARRWLHHLVAVLMLAGCAMQGDPASDRLEEALGAAGLSVAPCASSFRGEESDGSCFEGTVSEPLPVFAVAMQDQLRSAGLLTPSDGPRCLKLAASVPDVMGNCSFRTSGQLSDAGYDMAFVSAEFTLEQLSEMASGDHGYPGAYRVVMKVRQVPLD